MNDTTIIRTSRTGALENLAVRTLTGDVRDAMLHRLKHEQDKRAWSDRSEDEQKATINQITQVAEALVRGVVRLIGAEALPALPGILASVAVKDGIKAVIELGAHDENRHALFDAQGKQVMIVLADPTLFFGARAEWAVKKDQPNLPLDGDGESGFWVLGTGNEGEDAPRFESVAEALIAAGADFWEPREMGASGQAMTFFGVLLRPADENAATTAASYATLGEAMAVCQKAKDAEALEVLNNLEKAATDRERASRKGK